MMAVMVETMAAAVICNDYDNKEKAATPTVTPTAMATAAATATEGNGRCNFSQLQWQTSVWR